MLCKIIAIISNFKLITFMKKSSFFEMTHDFDIHLMKINISFDAWIVMFKYNELLMIAGFMLLYNSKIYISIRGEP